MENLRYSTCEKQDQLQFVGLLVKYVYLFEYTMYF